MLSSKTTLVIVTYVVDEQKKNKNCETRKEWNTDYTDETELHRWIKEITAFTG
jgi:hypothetical protein